MKRCTAVRLLRQPLGSAPTQFCQCRQKSEGVPERPSPFFRRQEFARKTEKGLEGYDKKLKVDSINKTVGTSVGDLPISPVMDPRWMEARTRYRTPKPRRPKDVLPAGRFRRKLEANPYGYESGGDVTVLEDFATYDVPKAKYERKLPVYDLRRLLGEGYLAKLRETPIFRDSSLFVLRKQRSIPLQLYLWKLQAYIAEHDAPEDKHLSEPESADDLMHQLATATSPLQSANASLPTRRNHSRNSSQAKDRAIPGRSEQKGHKSPRNPNNVIDSKSSALQSSGRRDSKGAWQSQAGLKKDWAAAVSSSASAVPGRKGL
ncbi:uncharacterized protein ColSpa_09165 [Colletotrichum spaethianum]|uniref:Uncharacterized protein n=1 Tax=Colletotrichum spaethianum TaxID=700344 RepID=A0AA37PB55_9PEZI|nr:uncharacterized protein ColSpa_09165 [Colletotrichum spaethianum]GKT48984.1 hypothetical protein ColSpa_09165 [Colletotrichum spaethianum]